MKLNVKAENITLTPDVYSYLEKKLANVEKILEGDSAAFAQVEIGKSSRHHKTGNFFEARIQLHYSGQDITVQALGESVYAAIDGMKDELSRELTSLKDRHVTQGRKGGRRIKELLRSVWPFGGGAA